VSEVLAGDIQAAECDNLGRVYSSRSLLGRPQETVALKDLSLRIPQRTVFGLLGPNGAGKTTTVRVLATLLTPTSGRARVLGHDVVRQPKEVRKRIGLILGGDRGLYGRLTGRENLLYFGALNHMSSRDAGRRADELLEVVGLADRPKSLVEQYSRGMKQRLHIARGLMADPEVIFMDEPTTGLDPESAHELRALIPRLVSQGKTILLTTHYMFEADQLCETIAIINQGSLVALGTPSEIKRSFSRVSIVEVALSQPRQDLRETIETFEGVRRIDVVTDGAMQRLIVQVDQGTHVLPKVADAVGEAHGSTVFERDPTLEEAYLSILR